MDNMTTMDDALSVFKKVNSDLFEDTSSNGTNGTNSTAVLYKSYTGHQSLLFQACAGGAFLGSLILVLGGHMIDTHRVNKHGIRKTHL